VATRSFRHLRLIATLFKQKGDELPLKRKICRVGNGFAVFLPKSWVQLLEEKHGSVRAVSMEVNGVLTIKPIFKNRR
jgi:hypothetical protein